MQLIDADIGVLVGLPGHYEGHSPRDLWIEDTAAVSLLQRYFDEVLWEPARPLMMNGAVDPDHWRELTGDDL